MRTAYVLFAGFGFLAMGCGPDFVVDDVGINVGFTTNNNVVEDDLIESEKNVNTEQGNPYGAFVSDIKAQLKEDAPTIDLEQATITLDSTSDAAHANLETIFKGTLELRFVDDNAGTDTLVASVADPTGAGPLELEVNAAAFDDPDFQATLLEGQFKVKFAGTAAATAADANVNLVATLSFKGFK
jgi:hypothetical protein